MALPDLQPPSIAPLFLLSGHTLALEPQHDDVPLLQGESRKVRTDGSSYRIAEVEWLLSAEAAAAVFEWFESSLVVGNEHFTARVAPLGAPALYFEAQWLNPPEWEALHLEHDVGWRVKGTLVLFGVGSASAPGPATLSTSFAVTLSASAALTNDVALSVSFVAALTTGVPLSTSFVAALLFVVAAYELREDGGEELREDGGRELRESIG